MLHAEHTAEASIATWDSSVLRILLATIMPCKDLASSGSVTPAMSLASGIQGQESLGRGNLARRGTGRRTRATASMILARACSAAGAWSGGRSDSRLMLGTKPGIIGLGHPSEAYRSVQA